MLFPGVAAFEEPSTLNRHGRRRRDRLRLSEILLNIGDLRQTFLKRGKSPIALIAIWSFSKPASTCETLCWHIREHLKRLFQHHHWEEMPSILAWVNVSPTTPWTQWIWRRQKNPTEQRKLKDKFLVCEIVSEMVETNHSRQCFSTVGLWIGYILFVCLFSVTLQFYYFLMQVDLNFLFLQKNKLSIAAKYWMGNVDLMFTWFNNRREIRLMCKWI